MKCGKLGSKKQHENAKSWAFVLWVNIFSVNPSFCAPQISSTTVNLPYLSLQNGQGFCGVQVQPSCPLAGEGIVNSRLGMTERLRPELPAERWDQVTRFSNPAFIYYAGNLVLCSQINGQLTWWEATV